LTLVRSVVLASMRGDAVVPAVVVAGAVVDVAAGAVVDVVAAGVVVDVVVAALVVLEARVVVDVVVGALVVLEARVVVDVVVVLAAVAGVSTSTSTAVVLHCLLPAARYKHNIFLSPPGSPYRLRESMPRTTPSGADVAIVPATSIALLVLLPNLRLVVLGELPTRTSTHQEVVFMFFGRDSNVLNR